MCHNSMKKNNDTKDYSEQLEFLNSEPYYANASKKMLISRQIFRYAVPASTVTKKALTITIFRTVVVSVNSVKSGTYNVSPSPEIHSSTEVEYPHSHRSPHSSLYCSLGF